MAAIHFLVNLLREFVVMLHVFQGNINFFQSFSRFLTYDPGKKKRITAEDALKHAYFSVSAYLSHDIDYVLGDSI